MRRSVTVVLGLILSLILSAGLLGGCGGGSKTASATLTVTSVVLAPANVSLDPGQVLQLSVQAFNSSNRAVSGQLFTFATSNNAIQVSSSGLVCGGTWDSLTAPVVCTPVPKVPASTQITATAAGITSAPINVSVHLHVDSVQVSPPNPAPACVSQKQMEIFTAHAFTNTATYNGTPNSCGGTTPCEITATVGSFNWLSSSTNVATVVVDLNSGSKGDATAVNPGLANIVAEVAGTTSTPTPFTTCAPRTIVLTAAGKTSVSVAVNSTQALTATMYDVNGVVLSGTPATFSSSLPAVAAVNSAGVVSGVDVGNATIIASCDPAGGCNTGVNQPIYSNPVAVQVTGTAKTGKLVWVSSTQFATTLPGCNNGGAATGCTSTIPIQQHANVGGKAIAFPGNQLPTSAAADLSGINLFYGTDTGLLQLNGASSTFTTTVPSVLGNVLAISSKGVLLAAGPFKLRAFQIAKGTVTDTLDVSAQPLAAAWTPDGYKAYFISDNSVFAFISGLALRTVTSSLPGTATGVDFLATGNYGYASSGPSDLTVFATCNNSQQDQVTTLPGSPQAVKAVSDGKHMVTADASNVNVITVTPGAPQGCPIGVADAVTTIPMGVTYGTIHQLLVSPDRTTAAVLGDKGVTIVALDGSSVKNVAMGGATAFTGGITDDSQLLYTGGSDFKVHAITLATGADTPLTVNFPNQTSPVVPDLVTVMP